MKHFCVLIIATLAMASVACSSPAGGSADSSPSKSSVGSGPLDACTLIGSQRASAILGTTVTTKQVGPTPAKPSDASQCVYMTGSTNGGFMLIAARTGFKNAQTEARSQMAVAGNDQPPPGIPKIELHGVDGPGEAAYLGTSTAATQLHVLDHGVVLVVNINQPDSPTVQSRLQQLAQAAFEHLGQPEERP